MREGPGCNVQGVYYIPFAGRKLRSQRKRRHGCADTLKTRLPGGVRTKEAMMVKRHLGVMGMGVMGKNLALNAESKGFSAAGFDIDQEKVKNVAEAVASKQITVTSSLKDFVGALEKPRRILMMVPAGKAVDAALNDLKPNLEKEDIVIDGGHSYFKDTERRAQELEQAGLRFFGMG